MLTIKLKKGMAELKQGSTFFRQRFVILLFRKSGRDLLQSVWFVQREL